MSTMLQANISGATTLPRQWGRTETQIRTAPHGAIFVWAREDARYVRRMARWLRRSDIVIATPRKLPALLLGTPGARIVLDHALILAPIMLEAIDRYNASHGGMI